MKTVRIAITGFSHSGKTVFLTSLIHQILNWKQKSMINFPKKKWAYPIRARKLPIPKASKPFPYKENIEKLKKTPPEWPNSTTSASEFHLKFEYKKTTNKDGKFKPHGKYKALKIELMDYPGEWVADLPLMNLDFHNWSDEVIRLAKKDVRIPFSDPWLKILKKTNGNSQFLSCESMPLIKAYKDYLNSCRSSKFGFASLQPGHFLVPGDCDGKFLQFCPLPRIKSNNAKQSKHRTLYKEFEHRFDIFKSEVIRKFYDQYFSRAHIQIVLVDVLKILSCGMDSYEDHRDCLEEIINVFKYSKRPNFFMRMSKKIYKPWTIIWPVSAIEKTIFSATKADHATKTNHQNLRKLTEELVENAERVAEGDGDCDIHKMIISSIHSTESVDTEKDGRPLISLRGIPKGSENQKRVVFYPGEVPAEWPEQPWDIKDYLFPEWQARSFPKKPGQPVSHLNLDMILGLALKEYL